MNCKKFLQMLLVAAPLFLLVAASLLLMSCASKEGGTSVLSLGASPDVMQNPTKSKLASVVQHSGKGAEGDSIAIDSTSIVDGCYSWTREFTASTKLMDEHKNPVELNILISFQTSQGNTYQGGMVLYTSDTNYVEANVEGIAEGNHITVYYVEDEENTTGDMFKNHDKLVRFELSEGEYSASWYAPMKDYVDDSTVISIE